jgi:hypothetical protein
MINADGLVLFCADFLALDGLLGILFFLVRLPLMAFETAFFLTIPLDARSLFLEMTVFAAFF